MPNESLEFENLHLWRGERHVLKGVGFSLADGGCLEVTGVNGSGKTTLLRTLCGLMYPEEGRVRWRGRDVRADLRAFHAALAYLGHEPPLKADLSARENLHFWIGVRRRVSNAELDEVLARVGARAWSGRLVRTLSAGQKRRVALAGLALLAVPLWLLDEPTTNLDAEGRRLVGSLIAEQ
ncbi:MAG TPA: heme ABC exporter ATP-binding protein CcmA, partial [Steroidobacteraceae bacterium]|nr:heme ABC exporter ATP-binding protein CcmA [Steroidobacteraceae bacterium]